MLEQLAAGAKVAAGSVVWLGDGLAQPFAAGFNGIATDPYAAHRGMPPLGISLSAASAGDPINVQILGRVDPALVALGAGPASRVGWDVDGVPVRAVDELCCSHPNYVGWCDDLGSVFVEPAYRQSSFNIRDFGATGDGVTDDTDAVDAALAAAGRLKTLIGGQGYLDGGAVVYVPSGSYRISRTLVLPMHTRLVGESMRTAALFFYLPATGEVEDDPNQGCGVVCSNQVAANFYPHTGVEELSIIGAWTGTITERAMRLGAGVLFKGGGPLGIVRRCAIEGWRVGVWCDTVNLATIEQCNFGGNVGWGYPDGWTREDDPEEAYPFAVKTWGVWLASAGFPARIDSVGEFEITGGETLEVAYDDSPDDSLSAPFTVTFLPGDTTLAAVVARINAAAPYTCASDYEGALRLSGRKPSWWSRLVVGGTAVEKLGLTESSATGSGAGLGNEVLGASGVCNLVHVRDCQFNGHHTGIYLEDGAGHTIESCNFNYNARVAELWGGDNAVFRKCVSEGCWSTGYFYVVTADGLTIESCEISGFHANSFPEVGGYSRPTHTAFVEFAPGVSVTHIRIRDNLLYGTTGPDQDNPPCAQVNNAAAQRALAGQVDIRGNVPFNGVSMVGPYDVWDSGTLFMNEDRRGCLGIGTAQPEAFLDISPSVAKGSVSTLKFKRQIRGGSRSTTVEALSLDDTTREHGLGRQTYDDGENQQGMVEVLQSGTWQAGDPDSTVTIDVRRHTLCDFEITILMRSATTADAKRWRFRRLLYWYAGTAYIDTDESEDTERTIGTTMPWLGPTITIDGSDRLTISIKPPTTEGTFGTWITRTENLQRSVF